MSAPEDAGVEFGLGVGGVVVEDLRGRLVGNGLLPGAPGVKEAALDGQNAVKAGEQKGWALGGFRFEQ